MFKLLKWPKRKKIDEAVYTSKNGVYKDRPHVSDMLPWVAIDPDNFGDFNFVRNNDFSLFAVFRFRGPDMASATNLELMQYNNELNNIIKTLPTGFVIYFDAHRHYAQEYVPAEMPIDLAQVFDDERRDYYQSTSHFDSDYYFILYEDPPEFIRDRILDVFLATKTDDDKFNKNYKIYIEYEDRFKDRVARLQNALSRVFQGKFEKLNQEETLTYLHSILSDREIASLRYNPTRFVSDYVADAGILGGREPKIGNKYMKVITVLNFPSISKPGIFDAFNGLDIEYRWNSRFICLNKLDARKDISQRCKFFGQQVKGFWTHIREAITREQSMDALDETALSNRDDAQAALGELGADYVSYGYYTFSMKIRIVSLKRLTVSLKSLIAWAIRDLSKLTTVWRHGAVRCPDAISAISAVRRLVRQIFVMRPRSRQCGQETKIMIPWGLYCSTPTRWDIRLSGCPFITAV
ncbi:hypothetical protein [uncultured Megasphaera sp.]|uniref:hypothetical protein n=1 Tax=uncultured Megasphaera sp. TaxID=165188 RepID=UPI00258385A3|nr:hypothetical protein [uncultured Megasphaera sp.]